MTILEMYNKGYAVHVIASEFGISRSTVNRRLRLCEGYIPRATGNRPINPEYVKLAATMFSAGSTWSQIVNHIGFEKRTFQRAVKNYAAQDPVK